MKLVRCLALCVSAAAVVAACSPEVPRTRFTHGERRGMLESNGLRFVIMPDKTASVVEVDVHYEVGAKEDPPGKAGLAHVVEHMMFQQRPDGPDTPPLMHYIGQITTFFNAFTSNDETHYMLQGRVDQLDSFLKIEAMRMHFRCQTISEEEFRRELEVVRNELRQNYGAPEAQMLFKILPNVYPKGHAYERMVIGTDEDLTSITLEDVCDFMDRYYVPERATVIVAGGVDVEKVTERIQTWFGKLDRKPAGPPAIAKPVTSVPAGKVEYQLDIERPTLVVAWPLPASNTREGEAVRFGLNRVFGTTRFQAQEYEFAYDVSTTTLGGEYAPVFAMFVELKGLDRAGEALDFIKKATAQAHRGFDEATWQQLEEFKAQASQSFLEGIEPLASRTVALGRAVQFDRDVEFGSQDVYLIRQLERIKQFDGPFVARAVKQTMGFDKAKVILFKPSKVSEASKRRNKLVFKTQTHERREVPEVDPREAKVPLKVVADFKTLGSVKRFELGNGMKVMLLPVESPLPVVSAQLIFDVGDVHSGSVPSLADVSASFLQPPRDNEALNATGIWVSGRTSNDHTLFQSSGLDMYLEVILRGLERTVKAGEYNQLGIENWQKSVREQFKRKDFQQQVEFQRQSLTALYGAEHPYTRNGVPSVESASAIGRDRLTAFKNEHYTAGNATLIVAGKFDVAEAEAKVRSVFGGWSRGKIDQPIGPQARPRTAPEVIGVVGDELPSMSVRIYYPAPAGIDGQEAARMVMTEIANIRMGDLRFKLGATYGVYAGRSPQIGPSAYTMGGQVDTSRAGEALRAMREGVEMMRRGDHFDIDFVRARRALIEQLLAESTVSSELVARLSTIARFDLQPDHYQRLIKQIAAVSPAQVKALIAKELDPKHEIVVCLGDRPTLERSFREAGLDQVKIVEPDYR